MSFTRDELLRPSLTDACVAKAPYSVQTMILTAFVGGPLAAIAITAVNSVRLRRWMRDFVPLLIALAAYIGFNIVLAWTQWGVDFRASLREIAGAGAMSYLYRVIAFTLFGLSYALHRKEQRSAQFMGLDSPNGWIAGIACVVCGISLQLALAAWLFAGEKA